jgi:gluconate 2-dehydrogenase gamma chain
LEVFKYAARIEDLFMNRREALRLLATGTAIQLAPSNLFAVLREARALIGMQTTARTLDPHQYATVTAIAELIIPKTETPGATDVHVGEFIDLIVTEWYNPEERTRFLNGLADVDSRTQSLFGKTFVESSPRQQGEILTALGEQMAEEADALEDHARQYRGSPPGPNQNFYNMLRGLTLTGYYTSEAGASRELDFQIIPGRYDGCVDGRAGKEEREN